MIKLNDFIGKLMFDSEKICVFSVDDDLIFQGTKSEYACFTSEIEYRVCTFYVLENIIVITVKEN